MIVGMVLAAMAGAAISLQTVFNNKVNEKTGSWMTTTLALGMGFLFAFIPVVILEPQTLVQLVQMETWYWFGGVIGVGVVFSLVQAMKRLGPTFTISVVLVAQLGTALLWDSTGWLGLEQIPLSPMKVLGILLILAGVLLFSYKKRNEDNWHT